jgi:tetratricopeptide (TPR) repeat protein
VVRKITRKELREPDQFHTMSETIVEYLIEHRNKFYAATSFIVLVIVVLCGWYFYGLHYEKNADKLYSSAFNAYSGNVKKDSAAFSNAVGMYREITEKYPKSRAATLSFYNMGNIYYNLEELDKSIEAYKAFLERSSDGNVLTSLAYYGLGYCYEEKEDYEEAIKSFENSNSFIVGTHFTVINYSNIARIYEKMKRPEKAMEYYERVVEQADDPFMKILVKRKMATLG